jgi:hypothetical protein
MNDRGNYLRVSTVLLAITSLCLPYLKNGTRKVAIGVLAGSTVIGFALSYAYQHDTIVTSPNKYNSSLYNSSPAGAPLKPKRQSYNCELKLSGLEVRPDVTMPLGSLFTIPYVVADVQGQNRSEADLRKNSDLTAKATFLTYRWIDSSGRALMTPSLRSSLTTDVPPGSRFSGQILVLPPDKPGNYDLQLSMIEEGEAMFDLAGDCRAVVRIHAEPHDVQPR